MVEQTLTDQERSGVSSSDATSSDAPSHLPTVAISRLALGAGWTPPSTSPAVLSALSLDAIHRHIDTLPLHTKAEYALTLLLPAEPHHDAAGAHWLYGHPPPAAPHPRAVAVLRYLASCVRVTSRTAYLARHPSSWDAASPRDTSLSLSLIHISEPTRPY